jgi:hypothetical protein
VRIPKFSAFGDEYINRKGFPSINVQATCNAREIFTSVDCQWPGSVHDNRIFKNSSIYDIIIIIIITNRLDAQLEALPKRK